MRFSSLVSLAVVTATFALGGCAAEAESVDNGTTNPTVALSAPGFAERTDDVRQVGQVGDLYANPADGSKAQMGADYAGGLVDQRVGVITSPFNELPAEKLGAVPPTFDPLSPQEVGIHAPQGFLPFSHQPTSNGGGNNPVPTYVVGGYVKGLLDGMRVVLQNNNADEVELDVNGAFTFPITLPAGVEYQAQVVKISKIPPGYLATCKVFNGKGLAGTDATTIEVACKTSCDVGYVLDKRGFCVN